MKLFRVGQTVNRAAQRNLHQIPINFGIADWWGYTGKVKKATDIGNLFIFMFFKVKIRNSMKFWIQKYFSSIWPRGPSWLSVQRTICCLPRGCRRNVFNFNMPFIFKGLQGVLIWTRFFFDTLWVPAGIKAEQFNVIDADAPGGSGLGSAVQFESVTNSSNMPSWYVNFNAWKFRQDWPSGNASRVSSYHFPNC